MDKPNPKTRKDVIQTALGKHEVPFPISEEQLDELAELSDGFVLLNLTQLVHETFNILVPMEEERNPDFKIDFEFLKDRFEKLKVRRKKFKEVVKKDKS